MKRDLCPILLDHLPLWAKKYFFCPSGPNKADFAPVDVRNLALAAVLDMFACLLKEELQQIENSQNFPYLATQCFHLKTLIFILQSKNQNICVQKNSAKTNFPKRYSGAIALCSFDGNECLSLKLMEVARCVLLRCAVLMETSVSL